MAANMGRPNTAVEPAMYVGVTKTCTFCGSTNARFKFLNNKNIQQPRYKCLDCNKLFTHNPTSRRKKHPRGYSLIVRNNVGATLLPNNATVACLNPRCGKVGASKFLFFNNGKVTQPRYKCGSCNTTFTHGGHLSLKRNFEDSMQAVGECGGKLLSSETELVNTTQDARENTGDWVGTLDSGTVANVGENMGDWPFSSDWNFDDNPDVGKSMGDWPFSSDWNLDDNPDVGQAHGIEVTAEPEVLGNNKRVTLSPRPQSEEYSIGYFMTLLQNDIEDGDRLDADHETTDAPVSRDSVEPAPAIDDEEEIQTQDMPNLMAFWEQ